MLTDMKVLSLGWKCVFYWLELAGKWRPYETETFEKGGAQREDEKNLVIRLVMFTPKVMVMRMPIIGSFYVLSPEYSKKSVPVQAISLNASEKSYLSLLQNNIDYGVQSYYYQDVNI